MHNVYRFECPQVPQTCQDMGLTTDDLIQLTKDYEINMAALRTAVLNMGKFAWQMLWTGGPDDNIGGTGLNPLVQQNGCAATLRRLCNATSPAQTRAMAFGLSTNNRDPSQLTDLKQDLANFLLIRGPYSWLGHGWLGKNLSTDFRILLLLSFVLPVKYFD